MRIAIVRGSLTATVKNSQLSGLKLLVTDVVDADGNVLEASLVAVDSLGAGRGDRVLLTLGSAARIPTEVAGLAIDATTVAIVDEIDLGSTTRVAPVARKTAKRISKKK